MSSPGRSGSSHVWPRVPGRIEGRSGGPTLIALGGIHGNEPAGLLAAERVLERIAAEDLVGRGQFDGSFVVLAGNRTALERGVRYVDRDLNRGWTQATVAGLGTPAGTPPDASASPHAVEDAEQRELWHELEGVLAAARGGVYFVDLHTTSAAGPPFMVVDDGPEQLPFALAFGLPAFLGLVGRLTSTLMPFLVRRGVVGVAIEGGQNEAASSVDHHEAILWIALVEAGLVPPRALRDLPAMRDRLDRARRGLPRAIEVYHRHAIRKEDDFRMAPGFANIQRIARGTLLAHDRHGEIRAPEDCLVVMPLYQGLGDDGFFLGREIRVG
ncbi:MAG: succinylglutamate desuccinylase/aspartoacylase family protein [Candidatus Eiseniibacteriota bacterium]